MAAAVPLVHTQLVPPRLKNYIKRPLLQPLGLSIRSHRVTTLTAPAGYGKSVWVASLLEEQGWPPTAWLSLDHHDIETSFILYHLVYSLKRVLPDYGHQSRRTINSLEDAGRDWEIAVSSLIEELPEEKEVVLVLDDFHLVENNPTTCRIIEYMAQRLPEKAHLVIISRNYTPLNLYRLRLSGELLDIPGEKMLFSLDEARELLRSTTTTVVPGTPAGNGSNNAASGLTAQYEFNSDFKDATGKGNDATQVGDVSIVDDSVMGKCALFNGGYLTVKSSPGLNLGSNFTISVWVMVDPSMAVPNNKNGPIISKLNDIGNYNNYIWYTRGTFGMRADTRTSAGQKLVQNKAFTDYKLHNSWSQMVFSGDGQNFYLYHNGSLIATQAIGSGVSITASTGDMRIGDGSDMNVKNLLFKGKMTDLRIYNRTLGASEISTLYSSGAETM